jgi:hypothetical protein
MKLNLKITLSLMLIFFTEFSSGDELCKNGRCYVNLDTLKSSKVVKEPKEDSAVTKTIKNKEINEKIAIKLVVK